MKIRRVVTGHDEKGKAVFVSDEEVEPLTLAALPGAEFHRLWGADSAPTFLDRRLGVAPRAAGQGQPALRHLPLVASAALYPPGHVGARLRS